jgi:transcriptional regulator with XRE-family HTH domain
MTDEEIGKTLRSMRRNEGIGLGRLAREIDVTKQHLLNIELARKNYSIKVLRKYLDYFGYNITISK